MKSKTATIRTELVWALLKSVGLACICMLIISAAMLIASLSRPFAIFFNQHVFGFIILFLLIFSMITIGSFLLLVKNRIQYLEEITNTLDQIAQGDLEIHIPVRTADELGKMADTVNIMAGKPKTSIEEERENERIKNDLITNLSHDLRTPLTSVLGYLDLITKMENIDENKLHRYASTAYGQCKDLKVLIDELFEFSKLSNPGIKINRIKVSIGELLEQVILGFIPEFNEAGMEYRLSFPKDKLTADIDPVLMTRVFDNLINNAVKYGSEGKYVDITLEREADEAVIRVVNYGKPIADADLPFVFDRFYRADKSRTGRQSGSGLGLAITKSIVELHDGLIRAASNENNTAFEVRLSLINK